MFKSQSSFLEALGAGSMRAAKLTLSPESGSMSLTSLTACGILCVHADKKLTMTENPETVQRAAAAENVPGAGRLWTTVGLGALVLYAAILSLIAVDQSFSLGIFPTPLERYLQSRIDDLGSPDATKTEAVRQELVEQWGIMAVDTLIRALDRNEPVRTRVRSCLRAITNQDFGMDVGAWSSWWEENGEPY